MEQRDDHGDLPAAVTEARPLDPPHDEGLVSLVPDVALLVTGAMPGTTTAGVVALMVMHVVTAAIAVTPTAGPCPPA